MPTAIISADHSEMTRTMIAAMKNSEYFDIVGELQDEEAARAALARGEVQFVLTIPAGFTRSVLRGERPALLVEADATDPMATGMALASVDRLARSVAAKDLTGPLAFLAGGPAPFDVRVHRLYNPEGVTQYNIIPGLMGVILTMTMVLMTGLAITRERERGTMENLLAMPAKPIEVMTGKIVPYIAIGLIQATIIILAARFGFRVPFAGSVVTLYLAVLLFVAACQPDGGNHPVLPGAEPAAGHADDLFLLSPEHPAFRIHVPVPGDACLGAVSRQPAPLDPLSTG